MSALLAWKEKNFSLGRDDAENRWKVYKDLPVWYSSYSPHQRRQISGLAAFVCSWSSTCPPIPQIARNASAVRMPLKLPTPKFRSEMFMLTPHSRIVIHNAFTSTGKKRVIYIWQNVQEERKKKPWHLICDWKKNIFKNKVLDWSILAWIMNHLV